MHLEQITIKELQRRYHKQMKIIMLWHLFSILAQEEIKNWYESY